MKGMFISFEGGEGAGKTTVLKRVAHKLTKRGYDVITTREPGGIEIAEQIRTIILDKENIAMDQRTEALLYAAARRQHLVQKVIPALSADKIVLCDRFIDSSLAYQGYARNIGIDEVLQINEFAIESCMPKLTLYFHCRPEVGLQRIEENDREQNRLDLETITFHQKVYDGYNLLLRRFPERMKKIDAERSIDEVTEAALTCIDQLIKKEGIE